MWSAEVVSRCFSLQSFGLLILRASSKPSINRHFILIFQIRTCCDIYSISPVVLLLVVSTLYKYDTTLPKGSGDEVPQKLKHFWRLWTIFLMTCAGFFNLLIILPYCFPGRKRVGHRSFMVWTMPRDLFRGSGRLYRIFGLSLSVLVEQI